MDTLRIEKILLYDISLPLTRPYSLRGDVLKDRELVIVQVISDRGVMGFGEAAPLPGFSAEPLKKVRHQLALLAEEWRGREIPVRGEEFISYCERALGNGVVCPSVRFALESAILIAIARASTELPCNILMPGSAKVVHSSGLLQGSLPEVLEQARVQKSQGITVFKLKVGNRNVPLDIRKVEELKAVLGPTVTLRLDANRSWRFDEALLFAQNIGKNQIEYFEEPCVPLMKWEELYRRTDIPLAIDESFVPADVHDLLGLNGLACFVVKPTVRGGVSGFCRLLADLRLYARKAVVSSSFESSIGTAMLANLAAMSGEMAALGPFHWLAGDTLQNRVLTPSGLVPVPRLNFSPDDLAEALQTQLVPF